MIFHREDKFISARMIKKSMNRLLSIAIAFLCVASPAAQADENGFVLKSGLAIQIPSDAPSSVELAADDLARDLGKAFGSSAAKVVHGTEHQSDIGIRVEAPGPVDVPRQGPESFKVAIEKTGEKASIVVRGADWRGCIYGIYEISHDLLGIAPFWYWTDQKIKTSSGIRVPWDWKTMSSAPTVRWRGWFPNDISMLVAWMKRDPDRLHRLIETMVRLRMNFMDVGRADPKRGLPWARACRDRGVAVTFTHTSPLGSHLTFWNRYWKEVRGVDPPPPVLISRADRFKEFYQHYIDLVKQEDFELIQAMGFRGPHDIPFWGNTPEQMKQDPPPNIYYNRSLIPADTPRTRDAKAATIQFYMNLQYELLRDTYGEDQMPLVRATLYHENGEFFGEGRLTPPSGPNTIWNFVAARVDHFPRHYINDPRIKDDQKIGYYMNLQFTPNGCYLANGEGPWKVEKNLRMVDAGRGDFHLAVFNAGSVREFILDLSAGAAALWDLENYDSDTFVENYSREYFGAEHSKAIARFYRSFLDAYWQPTKPRLPDFPRQFIFNDGRCARALDYLLRNMDQPYKPKPLRSGANYLTGEQFRITPEDSGESTQIDALIKGMGQAATSFQEVYIEAEKILPSLEADRRPFYRENLIVRAGAMSAISSALEHVAIAYRDRTDKQERIRRLETAKLSLEKARSLLKSVDQGKFEGWYDRESTFGFNRKLTAIDRVLKQWRTNAETGI